MKATGSEILLVLYQPGRSVGYSNGGGTIN